MKSPARRTRPPPLSRALAYRNDQILYKFMERWQVSAAEADELFTETKRLLWMSNYSRMRRHRFELSPALLILDEMWHTFVLFTREYEAYCKRVYGYYVHHHPTTRAERERVFAAARRDPEGFATRRSRHDVRQWRLIDEALGEEILLKWYVELPTRYSSRFFKTKAIPPAMSWRPPRALVRRIMEPG